MQDLKGLTVVSVEHAVAAPFASRKLADAGARVIKVERPEGDFARGYDSLVAGQSSYFVWLNGGKESIALDLKSDADKAILRRMIAAADIVIQNLGPGVMERLGFGLDDLCAEFPALIGCSISGYGRTGPRARQKAYDLLIQAESGLSGITGTPHGPARVGTSVVDITAGMTAYTAILEALIGRGLTGRGRHIEVSMYQAMAEWLNVPYLQHRYGGKTPAREGLRHPTIAPYGLFTCGDGQELLISIQNDREWAALMRAFGVPEYISADGFATNDDRVANRPAVDALVQGLLGGQSREETAALLDTVRIAYGRLSSMQDLVEHPQSRFADIPLTGGPVAMLASGAAVAGEAVADYGPVPALDQHGAVLRREFG
ncbi:CoA transferase [Pseudohalocynthiibacter aestuariivivens]|nr:CaiB/BaiF CoA-transferase family protein [Pseudohalocynthiibacter aestuariivivens]QIE46495.1 CoA transferase [Pseudohalocynthiibacter aestuariivivens]